MPEIQYPKNPNSDTAFVVQEDGTKNRALMTAPQDTSSLELPTNSNSCKGYVTVDGKKQRVILTADIGGGGGSSLPDQTGQSGKFLTTDGTDASWSDKALVNTATGANSLTIFGTASTGADTINIGRNSTTNNKTYAVAIGNNAQAKDYNAVAIGRDTVATYASSVAIGNGAKALNNGVSVCVGTEAGNYSSQAKCVTCIGAYARASASYAIEINASDATLINAEQGTLCIGLRHNNAGVNYKLLDSDGTIPEARLADTTNAAQGQVLTLDSNLNAVWQAGGGGSSYTAGTGIDITSGVISVTAPTLTNIATQSGSLVVGSNAQSLLVDTTAYGANSMGFGRYGVAFGKSAIAKYKATALGANTTANEYTIQLGQGGTNSDAGTMKVALTTSSDVTTNYELLSADGTIPAARHASLPAADGTYVLKLVIASGVPTLSWVAE